MQPKANSTNFETDDAANGGEEEKKARKRSNSFATILQSAVNMSSGIKEHGDTFAVRGITEEALQGFNKCIEDCRDLDSQQEILKGKLKGKTAALQDKTVELKEMLRRFTLLVKADIPQKRWVDFGMSAKK